MMKHLRKHLASFVTTGLGARPIRNHTPTLLIALACIAASAPARADRQADFNKLESEYKAVEKEYFETHQAEKERSAAKDIQNWDSWPGWAYLPRFVALAEEDPSDDVAYRCCEWIFERTGNVGADSRGIFPADQKAWQIIAAHHATGDKAPGLCLEATQYIGPAREQFLRGLLKQPNLSKEQTGYATLALAEFLAGRLEYAEDLQQHNHPNLSEFAKHIAGQRHAEFVKFISETNPATTKQESAQLFRTVLDRYADIPNALSARHFRGMATLGDKAKKSLHALEHLNTGAEAPDIVGQDLDGHPLKLKDYRGRVVLLSYWFTGCGPCMAMIPEERKLIEQFKDRPFTLLGVCSDSDSTGARKTAATEKITWPCFFDGEDGPINRDYNVLSWPTFYLIDENGHIAQKQMDREHLADAVAEQLDKMKP